MKISGLQENLKQGLLIVSHIAGKNVNLPILNNVLIEAVNGNIIIKATNLEIGVVCHVRGKVEKEGSFTVDSKTITEYISLLPNKKINIEQKDSNLIVETENYKTKIIGQSADDFPLIPEVDRDICFSADIVEFKKSISQVVFAVSSNESRVELSGVLFNFVDNRLILAATDSYRLAEKKLNIKNNTNSEERKIIIPSKTIQELIRILSVLPDNQTDNELKFYLSENQIVFSVNGVELVSRLIEGQYPDYTQIIPTNFKTKAIIKKTELTRSVKTSSIFSKTGINDVNFDMPLGKNKTIISSTSGQTGENISEIESIIEGDDNSMVVNFRYLLDGLNNIDSENVKIEIFDANTPCVLKPEKGDDYLYIIMPIKQ